MSDLQTLWEAHTDGRCCKWEHYFDVYERYLQPYRNKPITYLEIGVQEGGSLNLMREYLGTSAKIVGVDIDPKCKRSEQEGFEIHIGSQEDHTFLQTVAEASQGFDIIIDDGGHTSNQQIASFISLWPHLRPGGVYIVEDLHCSQYWPGWQASSLGINFIDYAKGLADKLSLWHMKEEWFHNRWNQPRSQRQGQMEFNNFAVTEIWGIGFYDSLIAIEKRNIPEPYQTRR